MGMRYGINCEWTREGELNGIGQVGETEKALR